MTRTRSIALSLSILSLAAGITAGCGGGDDQGFRSDGSKIDGDPSTTLPAEPASTKAEVTTRPAGGGGGDKAGGHPPPARPAAARAEEHHRREHRPQDQAEGPQGDRHRP